MRKVERRQCYLSTNVRDTLRADYLEGREFTWTSFFIQILLQRHQVYQGAGEPAILRPDGAAYGALLNILRLDTIRAEDDKKAVQRVKRAEEAVKSWQCYNIMTLNVFRPKSPPHMKIIFAGCSLPRQHTVAVADRQAQGAQRLLGRGGKRGDARQRLQKHALRVRAQLPQWHLPPASARRKAGLYRDACPVPNILRLGSSTYAASRQTARVPLACRVRGGPCGRRRLAVGAHHGPGSGC